MESPIPVLFLALMGFCTSAIDARVFLPYLGLLLYLMITSAPLIEVSPPEARAVMAKVMAMR